MNITLWGVRGSISGSSPETAFYGGNTTCVAVHPTPDSLIIIDAGSGLYALGETLPDSGECSIFITHGHSDHIIGLGFFAPLHNPNWTTHLYVPEWMRDMPDYLFEGRVFPVPFNQFRGNIKRHLVVPGEPVLMHDAVNTRLLPIETNHPGRNVAYRVESDDGVFLFSGDHEILDDTGVQSLTDSLLRGVDLALVDAMYNAGDYRKGWGHSRWEDWFDAARRTGLKNIILTHHAPGRTDKQLDALQNRLNELAGKPGTPLAVVAREGLRFELSAEKPENLAGLEHPHSPKEAVPDRVCSWPGPSRETGPMTSDWLRRFYHELSGYREESAILDRILAKTRELTRADAGTVYLAEEGNLVFAYTHNDTLFSMDSAHKHAYANIRIPITPTSIAGYAASTGKVLNIPDARAMSEDLPYAFNPTVDDASGYRTVSMLTIPFYDRGNHLIGVLQLINSLDPTTREPVPFAPALEEPVLTLAHEAASVLERSMLLRKNVYRLLRAASIHDPSETGPHAERVGSIAAELYQMWARRHNRTPETIRNEKSRIRLAAMLHDIGKVGISDLILKKPGKLTDKEFTVMRSHTVLGAALLGGEDEDLTSLASQIALHHHQKWNGTGYCRPGGRGVLSGEAIPVAARVTAVADVFDALVSRRCYKEPWTMDDAMGQIVKDSGSHFDPELVDCLQDMRDVLDSIYLRYPDTHKPISPDLDTASIELTINNLPSPNEV